MIALLLFNALLGGLLAAVLLRAAWRRRENQLLALAACVDAGSAAISATLVARGLELTSSLPMQVGLVGRILVVYPLYEFICAFPSGRRPPKLVRIVGVGATVSAVIAAVHPSTAAWVAHPLGRLAFFVPVFAASLRAMQHNLRHLRSDASARGAWPVLFGLLFVAGEELVTYVVVPLAAPQYVPFARLVDLVVTVLSYSVVAYAALNYHLFRVRGVVGEAVIYGTLSLSCLSLSVMAVELITRQVEQPVPRSLALALAVALPTLAWIFAERYAPALESALLSSIDPRRGTLKSILERALQDSANVADALTLCQMTRSAIGEVTGGEVHMLMSEATETLRWRSGLTASVLPAALSDSFGEDLALHARNLEELSESQADAFGRLGVDALVSVRAEGKLWLAFALRGGFVDRDALATAKALASNLGTKLAHHALFEQAFELQAQLDASHQLATLGSLTAALAHDIRTPLTSVKMNLELLRRSGELGPDMHESAELALGELRRIADYVSGMLDYAKPVELRAVECDFRQMVSDTIRTLQPLLEARRVAIVCEGSSFDVTSSIRADAARMKQILVNLLENATDASPPGSTVRVSLTGSAPDHVAIRVRDEGHGIEAKTLERMFEPFFTTRAEGTGLGLAIVSKLVRAHRGEIRVESELGRGSTFTVRLPV